MDGVINVYKEKGYTSHDVDAIVRKTLNIKKVGHTGTLDPNATGVLPILLGKGTKLSKYLINHNKIYEATLKLGEKTDTADIEGKITEEKDVKKENLSQENVTKILKEFIGKSKQVPPMYSAIKVNGKKLYEYARKGQTIEIKPRKIEIYGIELLNINNNEISFKVHCSKGTYIRTLCENIAEKLETVGYMKELKRIEVGEFNIKNAITLKELESKKGKALISIEEFLKDKQLINLNSKKVKLFLNGVNLEFKLEDGIYRIYNEKNEFIGTGTIKSNVLKRDIIV